MTGPSTPIRHLFFALLWLGSVWPASAAGLQNCSLGANLNERQRCDEEEFRQVGKSSTVPIEGGWRLVKTSDPGGGVDAVSVMHVVDSSKSDIGLAGLSLQCRSSNIEVVLIILEPLPRTARPAVVLTAGQIRSELEASVVQGDKGLLLPQLASNLAAGEWQRASELSVEIEAKPTPIRGVVPIGGLATALRQLSQNCPGR
jgi:hypothetical protein